MVDRFRASGKEKMVIIAVADFDPEGQDIPHSFGLSLRDDFGIEPDRLVIVKSALTYRQTQELDLPEGQLSDSKDSSRRERFIEAYGERVWELEALDKDLLEELVERTIQSVIDLEAFEGEFDQEQSERNELSCHRQSALEALSGWCLGGDDD